MKLWHKFHSNIIFSADILHLLTFLKYENIQKYTRVLKVFPESRHCPEYIPLPGYTEHNNPQVLLPWAFCRGNGIESIWRPVTCDWSDGLLTVKEYYRTENPVKSTRSGKENLLQSHFNLYTSSIGAGDEVFLEISLWFWSSLFIWTFPTLLWFSEFLLHFKNWRSWRQHNPNGRHPNLCVLL